MFDLIRHCHIFFRQTCRFVTFSCAGVFLIACNSSDGERFMNQVDDYSFSSTSSLLVSYGASRVDNDSTTAFRCPAFSGMSSDNNLTVFYAQATGPTPSFTLGSILGVRSESSSGFGISLKDFPIGYLDIYQRCHSSSYDRLVTSCPNVVEECSSESESTKECIQIFEGTHRLVISATPTEQSECNAEAYDRTPYNSTYSLESNPLVYACDAFEPIDIPAAIRGKIPSNSCCSENASHSFDFCIKPCGCRILKVEIIPKEGIFDKVDEEGDYVLEDTIRIGIFSNIESDTDRFKRLTQSLIKEDVNVAINLGNLTHNGSAGEYKKIKEVLDENFYLVDGKLAYSGFINETCQNNGNGQICCEELPGAEENDFTTDGRGRLFTSICNVVINKIAFMSGIGEDEVDGSLDAFRSYFGPTNFTTYLGKVQLIMLDTADATISSSEREWLESVVKKESEHKCQIPAPTKFAQWPTLAECHSILGKDEDVTCRECIAEEALCIPPEENRSKPESGPENCLCVPHQSKVCPGTLTCEKYDGEEHPCVCSRDQDCGVGGTCEDGKCKPPIKLVFSYTPLFDKSGARNNAFSSKREAASLLSFFTKAGVNAVFSGRVRDYQSYTMGGIPIYLTGKKNQWLLVNIPKAYSGPNPDNITISVKKY